MIYAQYVYTLCEYLSLDSKWWQGCNENSSQMWRMRVWNINPIPNNYLVVLIVVAYTFLSLPRPRFVCNHRPPKIARVRIQSDHALGGGQEPAPPTPTSVPHNQTRQSQGADEIPVELRRAIALELNRICNPASNTPPNTRILTLPHTCKLIHSHTPTDRHRHRLIRQHI